MFLSPCNHCWQLNKQGQIQFKIATIVCTLVYELQLYNGTRISRYWLVQLAQIAYIDFIDYKSLNRGDCMRHTLIILLVLGSFCFGQSSATTSYDELFKTKTTRFNDGTTARTSYDPLFKTSTTYFNDGTIARTSYDELFKTKTTRFNDGTTARTSYDPLFNTSKTIISPPKSDTKKYWEID